MRYARASVLLAAAALGLGVTACDTKPEERDRVRGAVQSFVESCSEGEGVAASEGLTESTREEFIAASDVLAGCRLVLGLESDSAAVRSREDLREARVTGEDAHGGFGSAVVELPGGVTRRVEAERTEGQWRLAVPPLGQ